MTQGELETAQESETAQDEIVRAQKELETEQGFERAQAQNELEMARDSLDY